MMQAWHACRGGSHEHLSPVRRYRSRHLRRLLESPAAHCLSRLSRFRYGENRCRRADLPPLPGQEDHSAWKLRPLRQQCSLSRLSRQRHGLGFTLPLRATDSGGNGADTPSGVIPHAHRNERSPAGSANGAGIPLPRRRSWQTVSPRRGMPFLCQPLPGPRERRAGRRRIVTRNPPFRDSGEGNGACQASPCGYILAAENEREKE